MSKVNHILYSIVVVSFLFGCKETKDIYYSYKINSYVTDTVKRFVTSSRLISYGDYLLEFNMKININGELLLESKTGRPIITYDTASVYLLQNKNRLYFEFDNFTIKNKIIKTGKLWDKQYGQKYDSSDYVRSKPSPYYIPVDTVVNNIRCYYATIMKPTRDSGNDDEVKMILIKKSKFNSLNKIGGAEFPDKDYCIIGIDAYSFKNNNGFIQEIDSLRPLTEKEKSICKNMLKKSRTAVTDTIKAY